MEHVKYPLRVLFWEATLRCNACCEFCGSRCGDTVPANELTREEICEVFRQIAARWDASQIMINVTGGEPLLRDDLEEIMQRAVSYGFRWGLVTNGMLLNAERIAALKQAGMKTAAISIDGLDATHDALRGVRGGLQAVLRNIRLLAEADFLESVMITTVVSKKNIAELERIKEMLRTLPIRVWRVCPVDPIGRAEDDKNLLLEPSQMRSVFADIVRWRQEDLPFSVTTSCSHYLGSYEFAVRPFPFRCDSGKTVGSILANGDIYVCPNVPRIPALIQGNVRTHQFADVWENGYQYFRDPESRHKGRCAACPDFARCQGDSLHTWSFAQDEPHFCMHEYGLAPQTAHDCEARSFADVLAALKGQRETVSDAWVKAQSLSRDIVLISPGAVSRIFSYFAWGTRERTNERLCALLGHIYRNAEIAEEAFLVCVEDIICLETPDATETALPVGQQTEAQTARALAGRTDQLIHLGYLHSHPNGMSVAMSLGDYQWHRQLFEADWRKGLTVILDPQSKQAAAYAGPAADHVELHLLGYRELAGTQAGE